MKTTILLAAFALAFGAAAAYPAPWGVKADTAEEKAAITARCWTHDTTKDVKIWPEGRIPLKVSDKPMKFLEHELNQSNVVIRTSTTRSSRSSPRRARDRGRPW